MSTCKITLSDNDRDLEYALAVEYDFSPEEKATGPSYASGGEPGYPAHVEISTVRCTAITIYCVANSIPVTAVITDLAQQRAIGDDLCEEHGDEIAEIVMQHHADHDDWLREEAAEAAAERREELRREGRRSA